MGHTVGFIPGPRLSELYYENVVAEILRNKFTKLRYSAGLVGIGLEVLGYDTKRLTDHNWGLRLFIFLSEKDLRTHGHQIDEELKKTLPSAYLGYPTSFGKPDECGVRLPNFSLTSGGHVEHYVRLPTIRRFLRNYPGIRDCKKIRTKTWLSMSQQRLLQVTRGKIYHDGLHIKGILQRFRYYPRYIWLYLVASQWQRISEEKPSLRERVKLGMNSVRESLRQESLKNS